MQVVRLAGANMSVNACGRSLRAVHGCRLIPSLARKTMKTKLSEEEKQILDSFEKGEWVPVKNLSKRKKELMQYARNTLKKEGEIMATILKRKNKFYNGSRFGHPQIRVYHRKGTGRKSPRYLLKCGCCDEKIEIYYDMDGLEIGGVNGAVEDWREILLPLLQIKH